MTHLSKGFNKPVKKRRQHNQPPRKGYHTQVQKRSVEKERFKMKPEAEASLKIVFSRIGKPQSAPFKPDPFQVKALEAIKQTDCLVMAPTGAGKTWIAEKAIQSVFEKGGKCWYASPMKALSNSKWVEFGESFGYKNVGILTGDTKENPDASIIVGTTEILRNMLYDVMYKMESFDCDLVILDEAHFLGDEDRGVVWEETMIYLPARINLLLLSATIGNGYEIAEWLSSLRGKSCSVIEAEKRPVPLFPLFLHPSGKLMPLLSKKKLYKNVVSYMEKPVRRIYRGQRPPFDEIIGVLRKFNLLPAIFFLKSRGECNAAVNTCETRSTRSDEADFEKDLSEVLHHFPYLKDHKQLQSMRYLRVAAHHGGQLPAWKFGVEHMMKKGHLDAVFATTTVAAGVDFPARTVVLLNSDQFNGREFLPLNATAFHQMTGRAGRRGQDNIGFMLIIPQKYMDVIHVKDLLFMKPEGIVSQIRNDFSMALNLLLSHMPEGINDIFEGSFASYQYMKMGKKTGRPDLWQDFQRYLTFLKDEGFVDERNHLTDDGLWASQLRLDQPLLIAECLRRNAFPRDSEYLLAAVIAPFVYDRDQDIVIKKKEIPKKLRVAYNRIISTLAPLSERMIDAEFKVNPLLLWTSFVMYKWAKGMDWERIIEEIKIAEGDLAMLISRTADNLQQIASLQKTHPAIARLAVKARKTILRKPVIFDYIELIPNDIKK